MKKIALASLLMSLSILLSRIIGFIRDAIIAAKFGSGVATDAYYSAFTIPDFLNYLLAGGAFSLSFIPIFVSFTVKNKEDRAWRLYSNIVSIMSVILIILIIILEIFTPELVKLMFPGFEGESLRQTVLFTRIVLPAQFFFYNGGIISAILMAKKRFFFPALAPLIYNLSIIIVGLIFSSYGMLGFPIGALLGAILGPFLLQFLALRKDIKYFFILKINDRDFLNFIKISIPIMLGLLLISLDDWLSKRYGSSFKDGTITYLNNSRRLVMVPIGVFAQANAQAILPFLSEYFSKNNIEKFNELARKTLSLVFFITFFAASWYLVFHKEIIQLVYQRGKFLNINSIENGEIFLFLSIAIPFWSGVIVISRFYYSMKNTIVPMSIGSLMLVLNIPLFIILPKYMGIKGLALTISIVKIFYFMLILLAFKKIFKQFELVILLKNLTKIFVFFSFITLIFMFIKRIIPDYNWFLLLFIGSSIQFVLSLFLAHIFNIEAYREFEEKYINRYKNKILRKFKVLK